MKFAKNVLDKIYSAIPKFALIIGLNTSEQACIWWFHQPKLPAKIKKDKHV